MKSKSLSMRMAKQWIWKRPIWIKLKLKNNYHCSLRICQRIILWPSLSASGTSKKSWASSQRRSSATWWAPQSRKISTRCESWKCLWSASRIFFCTISANATFARFQSCASLPHPTSANSRTSFKGPVKWSSWASSIAYWRFFGSRVTLSRTLALIWTNLCLKWPRCLETRLSWRLQAS